MSLPAPSDSRCARISLLALGASSVATQLILLREVLSTFGGNELVAGAALGIWLLVTGTGSALGGRCASRLSGRRVLATAHVLIALLPPAMLAATRGLPLVVGVRGSMLGLPTALLASLLIFLPFGLISGAMIPLAGRLLGGRPEGSARRVYALDTAGSGLGGLLFSLLLVRVLSHGWSLALFGWFNLIAAALLLFEPGRGESLQAVQPPPPPRRPLPLLTLLPALLLLFAGRMDHATLAWRFPGQQILMARQTPFAQLTVTKTGEQRNVFQDAIPLYSTGDLGAEARVHPALCQVPEGSAVLLIGGGVFGALEEAAKHSPSRLDYIELDATLFRLARMEEPAAGGLDLPFVRAQAGDGRLFLKGCRSAYDAILIDLPGPENAGLNRYYTEEFFRQAHRALRPGGVLSFPLPASPNYMGEEQLGLERSIRSALRASFAQVEVLSGDTHIFLARDRPCDLEIAPILAARGIETRRLLDYDWQELSDPFRREELATLLEAPASGRSPAPNRDLAPRAFGHLLDLQARKSGGSRALIWALAAAALFAAGLAGSRSRACLAVGTSGFAAMALELEILLLFQVFFGHLYLRMSLFVTLFLLGAAAGSLLSSRLTTQPWRQVRAADGLLAALALVVAGLGLWGCSAQGQSVPGWILQGALGILVLGVAAVTGSQFAAAGAAFGDASSTVGRLYLADLAGAAAGTIVTGLVLLPRFGLAGVTSAVVGLKIVSWLRSRS